MSGPIIHARPPSFLSCASLARELDVSEATVRTMVDKGVLPPPVRMGANVRWHWAGVLASLSGLASKAAGTDDAYMLGAKNATSSQEI
ncbi:helix-turn-helix transcriptional regulator [Pararhizobium sp.]|uniref:helix-turn-helix transcriptional regulator n=1 Tax=Pararhizobium sp. TaxID=1977563 RepID=UPI00271E35E5|nr:hypothetical protein [Pararhizobium sp.]MDO9417975.1 hypothetical protein [Pararhizobium sp.]